jgi:hypothetical protein
MEELVRVVAGTKQMGEIERRRRSAWEQEQEAKQTRREAEMEGQLVEMRQEIAALKAYVGLMPLMQQTGPTSRCEIADGAETYTLDRAVDHVPLSPLNTDQQTSFYADYQSSQPLDGGGYIEEQPESTLPSPVMQSQAQTFVEISDDSMVGDTRRSRDLVSVSYSQVSAMSSASPASRHEADINQCLRGLIPDSGAQASYLSTSGYFQASESRRNLDLFPRTSEAIQHIPSTCTNSEEFVQGSSNQPLRSIEPGIPSRLGDFPFYGVHPPSSPRHHMAPETQQPTRDAIDFTLSWAVHPSEHRPQMPSSVPESAYVPSSP